MADARPRYHVGMSGWVYAPWRGVFYPKGLKHDEELAYAAAHVNSIEINGSFYSLQRPSSWQRWRDTVPDAFVFSVKGPRFITHMRRLEGVEEPLANFFASGLLALGAKLGVVLWQLPASIDFDVDVVRSFLEVLPKTTTEAATLARRRSERMHGREWLDTDAERPLRHAIEPRSHTFDDDRFAQLLTEHGVAAVLGDSAGKWPVLEWVTTDFAYARLHGDTELYASGYDAEGIAKWEEWTRSHLDHGREVYVYFDNDMKVRAPFDAMTLLDRLRAD